jgi:hypothetical protein
MDNTREYNRFRQMNKISEYNRVRQMNKTSEYKRVRQMDKTREKDNNIKTKKEIQVLDNWTRQVIRRILIRLKTPIGWKKEKILFVIKRNLKKYIFDNLVY